jgi:hypothetical protein
MYFPRFFILHYKNYKFFVAQPDQVHYQHPNALNYLQLVVGPDQVSAFMKFVGTFLFGSFLTSTDHNAVLELCETLLLMST